MGERELACLTVLATVSQQRLVTKSQFNLAKQLVLQLEMGNNNGTLERKLQTFWDEALSKREWISAIEATNVNRQFPGIKITIYSMHLGLKTISLATICIVY